MSKAKPFSISKQVVWDAYKRVKAKGGSAGVDSESIEDFETSLKDNLYKIWNRMSSGTYFPPPVLRVEIPKGDGGTRNLGIPTVSDRIAQTVVKTHLEPVVEPSFHEDSYGYRPKKSAIEAVGVARKRCWRYDWVLDLDIKGFFDNLDHALIMRGVRKYTECRWVHLYIERWLKAPVQLKDGKMLTREKGTPQGSVVSPLLANIFMHLAFDTWMKKNYPHVPFERYADDVVVHCRTEAQAQEMKMVIAKRLVQCKLELHPEKTKIVYCKDDKRRGSYPEEKFDFLGYTFRSRLAKDRQNHFFVSFSPAISNSAGKAMRQKMKRWRVHLHSDQSLEEIAREYNPVIRGWVNYYSRYCKSAMYPIYQYLNRMLVRWAMRKYKRFRRKQRRATYWLRGIAVRNPNLLGQWCTR